jgi:flagellar basal-body rod protein FlgB
MSFHLWPFLFSLDPAAKKCRAAWNCRVFPRFRVDIEALPRWRAGCIERDAMLEGIGAQLERYMDLLSARQKLVSANIANADTPGYHTQDLDFDAEMRNAAGGAPQAIDAPGLAVKNDGNNVSLDREARLLSENALRFQVASGLMHSQIQTLQSAIQEGKTG